MKFTERLGDGAQAEVFSHPKDKNLAVKIYKDPTRVDAQRIDTQIQRPPRPLWNAKFRQPYLTWPLELVLEPNLGSVLGYTMPRIQRFISLEEAINPAIRISEITQAFLLDVAITFVERIYSLHWDNYVGFDANFPNITVSRYSEVCLIDCDCLQFVSPQGQTFFAEYGRPELFAPELLQPGVSLNNFVRTKESDYWTVGVVVHHILRSGEHPFSCHWIPSGKNLKKPSLLERIRKGFYPDSAKHREFLPVRTISPRWAELPAPLRQLFLDTFDAGHMDPTKRSAPLQWITVLKDIRSSRVWG